MPLTNKFNVRDRLPANLFSSYIDNVTETDSLKKGFDDGAEAIIDMENLELNIKVKKNQQVIDSREKNFNEIKNEVNSVSENIIVVYVDTVSRRQMYRKMPKTIEFLKRYIKKDKFNDSYKEKISVDDSGNKYKKNKTTFEFFRYHSIDNKTFDNLFQLHYGYQKKRVRNVKNRTVHEFSKQKKKLSLFDDFKKAGYIVGHAMNTCSCKCIFRGLSSDMNEWFKDEPADHELMTIDPMYINRRNYFDPARGINSFYRRCLYGKDTNEYAFQYGEQFLKEYRDQKKVLYLEFTDGHEITSEVVQYIDDPLYNFLMNIEKEGLLEKNTTLYLLSDHGQHLVSAFYLFGQIQGKNSQQINDVYSIERMLPMFYILSTNDVLQKNQEIYENLQENSQAIFGMGEIRETLLENAYGTKERAIQRQQIKEIQEEEIQKRDEEIEKIKKQREDQNKRLLEETSSEYESESEDEQYDGEYEYDGELEYDGEYEFAGEFDGEQYDGEEFDGEEFDGEYYDGEKYDGEQYYDGEEYDGEYGEKEQEELVDVKNQGNENEKINIKFKENDRDKTIKSLDDKEDDLERLEFAGIQFERSLFSKLQKSRSCYDIGMVQFPQREKFCSCKPWEQENEEKKEEKFLDKK